MYDDSNFIPSPVLVSVVSHKIPLNKYCTYNKPNPKISHVKTLQNLCNMSHTNNNKYGK